MNRWIGYACIEFAAIKNRFAHSCCQTDKHTWKWMGWKIEYGSCWQLWLYFECWFIVIVSLVWRCKMQIDSFDVMGYVPSSFRSNLSVLFFGCWSFHPSELSFLQCSTCDVMLKIPHTSCKTFGNRMNLFWVHCFSKTTTPTTTSSFP